VDDIRGSKSCRRPRLPGIVDLRDGGFKLAPDPTVLQVRLIRWFRWGAMALALAAFAAGINYLAHRPQASWVERLEVLGIPFALAAFFWIAIQSPTLRVTGRHISFGVTWPFRLFIRRSDFSYVYRGQALEGRRGWTRCYFLVTRDDTPRITIIADNFSDEGMTALATRLGVPIKGDFSAEVRARFD
jgi:hypothetical protein